MAAMKVPASPDYTMFVSPGALSDIILVVDGRKLHVNMCVLGFASPVFLRMFEGDYKDRTEIPLADKKYEDVVELLLCIYPSTSKPITEANIHAVLPLADEYGIESLKVRCELFLLNLFKLKETRYHDPPNKNLVHYLYLADKYKLKKLLDVCIDKVKFRTYGGQNGIKCLLEFKLLSVDTKFMILSERIGELEGPVKDLMIEAVSISDEFRNFITDSKSFRCQDPTDCDHWVATSCTVKNDVRTLITKLCKLGIHFHKDPSTEQRKTQSKLA